MSENKFSDNELEEPEGFWPEGTWHDQEPPENVPYLPDPLELLPDAREFPPAPHPADEPSAIEPADAYDPYNAYEQIAASDQPEQPEEAVRTSPFDARVYDAPPPKADDPWQISDINVETPDDHVDAEGSHHTPELAPDQYAYHTTEEPLSPEPPQYLADSASWQDDTQQTPDAAAAPPHHWETGPQPSVDPFAGDPFSPTAAEDYWVGQPAYSDPNAPANYIPETPEETIRRSGLAWSAGIAFFGSVAFMLFLGWIADLLLGTSPWGMVGGIVLGSIIGFIQFFRISSQIYGTNKQTAEFRPLLAQTDDEIVNEHADPPATPPVI